MQRNFKQSEVSDSVPGLTKKDIHTCRARGGQRHRYSGRNRALALYRSRHDCFAPCTAISCNQPNTTSGGNERRGILANPCCPDLWAGRSIEILFHCYLHDGSGGATLSLTEIDELVSEGVTTSTVFNMARIVSAEHPRIRALDKAK
jgi:hypothetical protein